MLIKTHEKTVTYIIGIVEDLYDITSDKCNQDYLANDYKTMSYDQGMLDGYFKILKILRTNGGII